MTIFFLVLMLGVVNGRVSCNASASERIIGPGDLRVANARLEKAVRSIFEHDAALRTADLGIRADVTNNEVTLSGAVDSEAVRSRAVELAKRAQVGVVVNDQLKIMPRDWRRRAPEKPGL